MFRATTKKGWIVPAPTDHQPSQIFASLGKNPRKTATQTMSLEARGTQETIQSQSQYVAEGNTRCDEEMSCSLC